MMNLSAKSSPPKRMTPVQLQAAAMLRLREIEQSDTAVKMNFKQFTQAVNPNFKFYRHCEELSDVLERVVSGELKRVMIFEPPRHGKSEMVSRTLPAYFLYRRPHEWFGISSYGASLAYGFSRISRDRFLQVGGRLKVEAATSWETHEGGGCWAAGVGGGITGKGFSVGLIDDPLKDAEEAMSATIREKHKLWYESTFYTRAEPNAAIIITMTRWHEDDLAGWQLSQEKDSPENWYIVRLPSIYSDEQPVYPPSCTVHSDWRTPGEALCPERYSADRLIAIKKKIGDYFWQALHGQVPPKGGLRLSSRVFANFEEVYHVVQAAYTEGYPVFVSLDFNKKPMCGGVFQIRPASSLNLPSLPEGLRYAETLAVQIDEFALYPTASSEVLYEDIGRWIAMHYKHHEGTLTLNGDTSGNNASQGTNKRAYREIQSVLYQTFSPQMIYTKPNQSNPSIEGSADVANKLFRDSDGVVRFVIGNHCKQSIIAYNGVRWEDGTSPRQIDKSKDLSPSPETPLSHFVDLVRYFAAKNQKAIQQF